MSVGSPRVLVAGVGNIFLSDDGFGPAVIEILLQGDPIDGVTIVDYGIRGLHLAYDIADATDSTTGNALAALILVDAIPDAGGPGKIRVIEVDVDGLTAGSAGASGSTGASGSADSAHDGGPTAVDAHSMDPVTVLRSVRNLGVVPPPTFVVGCQPESLEDGIGLSPTVAAAVVSAAAEVRALAAARVR